MATWLLTLLLKISQDSSFPNQFFYIKNQDLSFMKNKNVWFDCWLFCTTQWCD